MLRDSRLSLPGRLSDRWLGRLSFEAHLNYAEKYDYYKELLLKGLGDRSEDEVRLVIGELSCFWWAEQIRLFYGERMLVSYMESCFGRGLRLEPLAYALLYQMGMEPREGVKVWVLEDKCVFCGLDGLGVRVRLKNGLPWCGCQRKRKYPLLLRVVGASGGRLVEGYLGLVSRIAKLSEGAEFGVGIGVMEGDRLGMVVVEN